MTQNATTTIDGQIVVVAPEFHLWSGRRAIKADKLSALNPQGINLPPAGLASLGSVKLVDPDKLKPFDKLKDETHRLLASHGIKLFGGYAIHEDEFKEVFKKLQSLQAHFNTLKTDLLITLDASIQQWVTNWVTANHGNQHLLQNLPDAQTVFGKMSFDFHSFRIAPPSKDDAHEEAGNDYRTKLQGLRGELYREAAREASVLMSQYLVNENGNARDYITQKTLRPVKRIADRLRQFTFVDVAAGALADVIDWTMQQVPAEGRVDGPALMAVWNMARLLSNPEEAARLGQIACQTSADTAWSVFEATTQLQAEVQAEVVEVEPESAAAELMEFADRVDSFNQAYAKTVETMSSDQSQQLKDADPTTVEEVVQQKPVEIQTHQSEASQASVFQPSPLASDAMGFLF